MSDQRALDDITEPVPANEAIDSMDANDPQLATDATDPTLPIERIDPLDAIERMESRGPTDSSEPLDHSDQREGASVLAIAHYGTMPALLILGAQVSGCSVDVRVADGVIRELAPTLAYQPGEEVIDAGGGALLPGLHDHHLHLLALSAAQQSVRVGPPDVRGRDEFATTLRAAAERQPRDSWIRAVGYHESVAGPLDRDSLDRVVADRPMRVQHRSGGLWILNSAGLRSARLEQVRDRDVERDPDGRLTGRLWRQDAALRLAIGNTLRPSEVRPTSQLLAAFGITGITDATPDLGRQTIDFLAQAIASGTLGQEVTLLGAPLHVPLPAGLRIGPMKLLLRDHDLPALDELSGRIRDAHQVGRPVAVHCVTRESLLLTLAALDDAGHVRGDRIEHAAVVPPEARETLRTHGISVITQPAFVCERGDDYVTEVDAEDQLWLYPYRSLLDARIPVAPSSDAPFGTADPWKVIAAAARRRAASGRVVGARERVDARTALAGYLSAPDDPGGPPRQVRVGAAADLCLLGEPLEAALADPSAERIQAVLRAGRLLWQR